MSGQANKYYLKSSVEADKAKNKLLITFVDLYDELRGISIITLYPY